MRTDAWIYPALVCAVVMLDAGRTWRAVMFGVCVGSVRCGGISVS